ncbi:alpha/beta hydrolase [Verrucomicrobiota bacterium]
MKKKRSLIMEIFLSVLKIGTVAYLGLCLLVFLKQPGYVYYPDKDVGLTPEYLNLKYEDVRIKTEDGETIAGWFVSAPERDQKSACTVLFCHGNAGDIGDRPDSIMTFHKMGLNVLIFDYRGYGDSSGKPTEKGTYLDAKAVWEYLTKEKNIDGKKIVIFGRSLGGAIATWLAEQTEPGALVVESTFTSAPDMAKKMFWFLPRFLCRFKYDSINRIADVGCPVLIAHSKDDDMIPFKHGQRLFKAAVEPKCFVEMRGSHNAGGLDADTEYQKIFQDFLEKHMR